MVEEEEKIVFWQETHLSMNSTPTLNGVFTVKESRRGWDVFVWELLAEGWMNIPVDSQFEEYFTESDEDTYRIRL